MQKRCKRCGEDKDLNESNFYLARPRVGHKKQGWQSNCKECWKEVNAANKLRIKLNAAKRNN